MTEMARDNEEALTVLGRIVGDRSAAMMIFGKETPGARSLTSALSTERDFLTDACEDAIKVQFNKPSCPFAQGSDEEQLLLNLLQKKA